MILLAGRFGSFGFEMNVFEFMANFIIRIQVLRIIWFAIDHTNHKLFSICPAYKVVKSIERNESLLYMFKWEMEWGKEIQITWNDRSIQTAIIIAHKIMSASYCRQLHSINSSDLFKHRRLSIEMFRIQQTKWKLKSFIVVATGIIYNRFQEWTTQASRNQQHTQTKYKRTTEAGLKS